MNTRKLGAIAVAKAIAWFTENGYNVSVPVSETQRYDLIVEKGSICYRVETKSSITDTVDLRTLGGNQSWGGVSKKISTDDADLLFATTNSGLFLIPVFLLEGRSTIKPTERFAVQA